MQIHRKTRALALRFCSARQRKHDENNLHYFDRVGLQKCFSFLKYTLQLLVSKTFCIIAAPLNCRAGSLISRCTKT